jgi:hypothetical protein
MVELFDAFTLAEGGWMFSRAACPECSQVCRERAVQLGDNLPGKLLRQGLAQMEAYPGPLVGSDHFKHGVCSQCSTLAHEAVRHDEYSEDLGAVFRSSVALRVLEEVWADIRSQFPDVPDAVMVLASGIEDVKGPRFGHWAASRWRVTLEGELRAEVMVAGEGLNRGAVDVMGTLLHEAAHGVAHAQQEQDCSRQGRYHNKVFKRNAESLGLEVGKRSRHGWSETSLVMTGRNDRWWWAVRKLKAVCALGERLPPAVGTGTQEGRSSGVSTTGQVHTGRHVVGLTAGAEAPMVTASLTDGRRVTLACGCSPVRRIRVVASVASLGDISCGVCALPFRAA